MKLTKILINLMKKLQKYSIADTMSPEDFMSMSSSSFPPGVQAPGGFLLFGEKENLCGRRIRRGFPGKKMKSLYVK